jgi:hypothetical protein
MINLLRPDGIKILHDNLSKVKENKKQSKYYQDTFILQVTSMKRISIHDSNSIDNSSDDKPLWEGFSLTLSDSLNMSNVFRLELKSYLKNFCMYDIIEMSVINYDIEENLIYIRVIKNIAKQNFIFGSPVIVNLINSENLIVKPEKNKMPTINTDEIKNRLKSLIINSERKENKKENTLKNENSNEIKAKNIQEKNSEFIHPFNERIDKKILFDANRRNNDKILIDEFIKEFENNLNLSAERKECNEKQNLEAIEKIQSSRGNIGIKKINNTIKSTYTMTENIIPIFLIRDYYENKKFIIDLCARIIEIKELEIKSIITISDSDKDNAELILNKHQVDMYRSVLILARKVLFRNVCINFSKNEGKFYLTTNMNFIIIPIE